MPALESRQAALSEREGLNRRLFEALEKSHYFSVKAALEKGADVNTRNSRGETALVLAASAGLLGTVKLLLEKGANKFKKTAFGLVRRKHRILENSDTLHTKKNMAAVERYESILWLLDPQAMINGQLIKGTALGDFKKAKDALEKGANVNARDNQGLTPLMYAAANGHEEILELLLEYNADIHARNKKGRTALWLANRYEHLGNGDILRSRGAPLH